MFHVKQELAADTIARLTVFADLLERWNRRINLVSAKDIAHLWPRHIEDSLQLAADLPTGMPFTDLGSGGGFPGLILAIATGNPVTLVESDQRKASFLREAARATGATAMVVAGRIEQAEIPRSALVTARALAPLPVLLGWASRYLLPDGHCLFLKGRTVDDELTAAAAEWHMTISRRPSRTSPDGVILRLGELRRVREPDRATGR
jgi:16S rRNA (guanine527-N7)-methyltransferase